MGNAVKNSLILVQVLLITSLACGQFKNTDYSHVGSRFKTTRVQSGVFNKRLVPTKNVKQHGVIHRQFYRSGISLMNKEIVTSNAFQGNKINDNRILKNYRLAVFKAENTREKTDLTKKIHMWPHAKLVGDKGVPLILSNSQKRINKILPGSLSMQDINRYNFRRSHAMKPGLPVKSVVAGKASP